MAKYITGVRQTKQLLRNLEPAARQELADEGQAIVNRLLGRAKAETPVKSGGLRDALQGTFRMGASMIMRIGLIARAAKRRFFYGYILDQGRKAQTVQARRRRKDGTISTYALRIKGIDREKYNFVFGRRKDFEMNELPGLRGIWTKILRRASAGIGGGDD